MPTRVPEYNNGMFRFVASIWGWFWGLGSLQKLEAVQAVLVTLGIPLAIVKWLFFRPRLKLRFVPKETYHERLVPTGQQTYWLHLMCFNTGFVEAKKAQGYVTRVFEYVSSTGACVEKEGFLNRINLKWAHESIEEDFPKDILPRENKRLDICYIYQNCSELYFSSKLFPRGSQQILDPGKYVFEIVVSGENVDRPAKFHLGVSWDGTWKGLVFYKPELRDLRLYKASPAIKSFKLYPSQKTDIPQERGRSPLPTVTQPIPRESWTTTPPSQEPYTDTCYSAAPEPGNF